MNSGKESVFRFRLAAAVISVALFLLIPSLVGAWSNKLVVDTDFGKLQGYLSNDGTAMIWKGVPYAKPPVDDLLNNIELRWNAPQDPEPWAGIRDATKPAMKCIQLYTTVDWIRTGAVDPESSEDCLYVDIFRPNNSKRLPVYVWIHGGSNNFGSAKEYNGEKLATQSEVVVVVVQYRLGPMGWFYHPALQSGTDPLSDSGNFGTLDHAQALRWIKENIDAFGGDPHRVTVAGESAGAHNTMNMVISPIGKGLFHRAIYQSGGMAPVTAVSGRVSANDYIEKLLMFKDNVSTPVPPATRALYAQKRVEMENNGTLGPYLRSVNAGDFFLALIKYGSVPTFPVIMDGYVMPLGGWIPAIQSGNYNKMPIILGSNEHETKAFMPLFGSLMKLWYGVPSSSYTWYSLFTSVRNNNVPDYMAVLDTPFDRDLYDQTGYFGSLQWKAKNVDSIARELSKVQDKVYAYLFKWGDIGSGPKPFDFIYGAGHAAEIPFFFGGNKGLFNIPDLTGPGARALQSVMMGHLSNFAQTGNPNSGDPNKMFPPKRTKWLQWSNTPGGPKSIVFDADFNGAKIAMMNEEVTFASAEAERQAWVADQNPLNRTTADNVTKFFLWQPPW
ncbi:MAG: carboxylesterase family protein [Deltaproteobacteria bacterium]|nr:carboxylesterase family protein [Deltaproteobacteria bacterium]